MKRVIKRMTFYGFIFFYFSLGVAVVFYNTPGIEKQVKIIGQANAMNLFLIDVGGYALLMEFIRSCLINMKWVKALKKIGIQIRIIILAIVVYMANGTTLYDTVMYILGVVVLYELMVTVLPHIEKRIKK